MVKPLGLYIHWPWCVRKCPYCDFNSCVAKGTIPESAYIDALIEDLRYESERVEHRMLTSIFVGGGTPSLVSEKGFERLMTAIGDLFVMSSDIEISMEANPGALEAKRFLSYADNGVNRFSLGVQSFDDAMLRALGRIHTSKEAMDAIELAGRAVKNVNIDLMFALPNQSLDMLQRDIGAALAAGTTHLSYYELTLEAGAVFFKNPPQGLPDEDTAADMADCVHERITEAGFNHYEVSGFAKEGFCCRHNQTYWRYGDYIGVGAGAHGKLTNTKGIYRSVRPKNPAFYMAEVLEGKNRYKEKRVNSSEIAFEFMLNALRLRDGVESSLWEETTGFSLFAIEPLLNQLRKEKLLSETKERIVATELGRRFLSDVQERFLEFDLGPKT